MTARFADSNFYQVSKIELDYINGMRTSQRRTVMAMEGGTHHRAGACAIYIS
jgi:hypothetical protein